MSAPIQGVTQKGQELYLKYLCAQEELRLANDAQARAVRDMKVATAELGKWLLPPNATVDEWSGVWVQSPTDGEHLIQCKRSGFAPHDQLEIRILRR